MKNFKTLLMACSLLYVLPALASDLESGLEGSINSNNINRVPSEERKLLHRQQALSGHHEVVNMQSKPSRTCWQVSKPYVITGGVLLTLCGVAVGSIIGWSEACLSLMAHNGTNIWCANNSTNNTGGWTLPWGGIP